MPLTRFRALLGRLYHYTRIPLWLGLGFALGFLLPYGWYLDRLVQNGFERLSYALPSRGYARALRLAPGLPMDAEALRIELAAARYHESADAFEAGSFRVLGARFEIHTRAFADGAGLHPARHLGLGLAGGRVASLLDQTTGQALKEAWVDPARIATLYGRKRQERRLVRLNEVPPQLIKTLLAVEDKHFYGHYGIDPFGIARAAWANLRAGRTVQGGSTLTQQLVRNLFLDRRQRLARKLNEIGIAVLIEWRYPKARILEAYLNEVYLGQQGAQAVHGVAAAAEFYFGHGLDALAPRETALLVGLIQGPSYYDPRREPAAALKRRNLVLREMHKAGVIAAVEAGVEQRAPLGVSGAGALPQNRYPAFLDLVRAQIARDYPASSLAADGLAIHTTLSPSSQHYGERAVVEQLQRLDRDRSNLQAAMVITNAQSGAIEAVVGDRNPSRPGFNRAVTAARQIGSLVKPFVYLVALAQPDRYSLITPLNDSALRVRQRGSRDWVPRNSDNREHGQVSLLTALANSYNLATVRLGLEIDVGKVRRVLEALVPGASISPHPSLLLGATELTPLQVAQAYQYLAADGHLVPLNAVSAVLDGRGRPLTRYTRKDSAGELVAASRLVAYAMQEAARSGTAHQLGRGRLGELRAAGKTSTSDDRRDSWFAGFTGSHLAVVWVGQDDNTRTRFYGATGALQLWAELFTGLPTEPLHLDLSQNPEMQWIDPQSGRLTDPECEGARVLPFIHGYAPVDYLGCGFTSFDEWFNQRSARVDPD